MVYVVKLLSTDSGPKTSTKKTGKRDAPAFQNACAVMFPVGRIFASSLQLQQTARKFLDQWAVSSTSSDKQKTNIVLLFQTAKPY